MSIKNETGYDVIGRNKPIKKVEMIKHPGMFMIGVDD